MHRIHDCVISISSSRPALSSIDLNIFLS